MRARNKSGCRPARLVRVRADVRLHDPKLRMRSGDGVVAVVLRDDRKSMLDRGCRDERVGELDQAVHAGQLAVRHEARPRNHHGFADRKWLGTASERQGIGSTCPHLIGRCIEHAELEFSNCHHRHRAALG